MKNLFIVNIAFISFITINAQIITQTDYRDNLVGNYFCVQECMKGSSNNDTINIIITKNKSDSLLDISFGQSTFLFKLKNNLILPYYSWTHGQGRFFSTDSISFSLSTSLASGICLYNGKKKK